MILAHEVVKNMTIALCYILFIHSLNDFDVVKNEFYFARAHKISDTGFH